MSSKVITPDFDFRRIEAQDSDYKTIDLHIIANAE
jgi:hypothetical protein